MEISELSSAHQRSQRRLPPSPRAAPWLVYEHGKDCKFQTFYNICDANNKSYRKYIPELSKRKIWQKPCHQGWLIILCYDSDPVFKYGDCFLWNPASLETIQLPNFLHCVQFKYNVLDCILSSPPRTSSSGSTADGDGIGGECRGAGSSTEDSMVYILLDGGGDMYEKLDILIYCHPGEKDLQKMVYVKDNKLYIMCMNGDDLEIEIQQGFDIGDEEILNISDFSSTLEISKYVLVAGALDSYFECHWLVCFGEVFRVEFLYIPRGMYRNWVTTIEIRKLDFPTKTWVKVKSLNDYVFFLNNSVQLCCLASELGLSKGGYVYFTQKNEMSLYRYDLEDNSILLSLPCPDLPKPWLEPYWLMISTTDHMPGKGGDADQVTKATKYNIGTGDEDDEKEDIEDAGPWAMLNDDHMVWLISNYLHTLDYIHLRAVSKKYRSILKLKRSTSTSTTIQTTDITPWLVLAKYNEQVFSFVNPMHHNENYLMNFPELLKGSRIRFSKGGWLLMSKDKTLFFYNPFNGSTVKLPDLPDHFRSPYHFSGISFSSSPASPDCVFFAVDKDEESSLDTFFIKKGDKSWTCEQFDHVSLPPGRKHLEFELSFNNPVFYHGAFYCLGISGTLGVFKFQHGITWEILTTVAPPKCECIYKSFLVECAGKLLSVLLGHLGKWVRVFRLEETEMVWVEVKHLGQHMVFLSNTSSFSAIAPTGRQMENNIFFPRLHSERILFYSLDTCMYH
ncbi:hypothetical protein MKW98_031276 [Papaver atlanticum]|uniref:KIB1-4 beta-propeller domain-containing protein n=1 Tax=Papaver atlanticum TaxID=357466 RepID=A0AAD4S4Y8_9MAGN|nr:hypothetical protein MKW98_031276 [Papaver atlanticum]